MNFNRYIVLATILFVFFDAKVQGQFRLPLFDVELKVQQNLTPGHGNTTGDLELVETTNLYAGAHIQLGQYIAVGGFYSRSLRGVSQFRFNDGHIQDDAQFLQKGIDVRFSTGRAKKWRQYLVIQYSGIEFVRVAEAYRLADKSNAIGASLGIMRRLSSKMYFNVIELGATSIPNNIFWFGSWKQYVIINAKTGLTYNIGKKK